jgi:hypothetical protein
MARHLSLLKLAPGTVGKGHLALEVLVTTAAGVLAYLAITMALRVEEVGKVYAWVGERARRLRARG